MRGGRDKRVRTRIRSRNEGLKATLSWRAGPGPQGSDARHWPSCFLSEPADSVFGQESPLSFRKANWYVVSQNLYLNLLAALSFLQVENHPTEWKDCSSFEHPKMLLWVRNGRDSLTVQHELDCSDPQNVLTEPTLQYGWCLIPSDTVVFLSQALQLPQEFFSHFSGGPVHRQTWLLNAVTTWVLLWHRGRQRCVLVSLLIVLSVAVVRM